MGWLTCQEVETVLRLFCQNPTEAELEEVDEMPAREPWMLDDNYMPLVTRNENSIRQAGGGWCILCLRHVLASDVTEWIPDGDPDNRTAQCPCFADTIVPSSVLAEMNDEQRMKQLKRWHKVGFE